MKRWTIVNREHAREVGRRNCNASAARRRERFSQRQREWRASHPDMAALIDAELADDRRRHERAARDKSLARCRSPEFRAAAKAWHEANREQRRQYLAEWKAANRGRCAAYNRKRDAARAGLATPDDPRVAAFYEHVRTADRLACYYCDRPTAPAERHVDHVVPLSKGGAHVAENLACACAACNLSKGTKLPQAIGLLF